MMRGETQGKRLTEEQKGADGGRGRKEYQKRVGSDSLQTTMPLLQKPSSVPASSQGAPCTEQEGLQEAGRLLTLDPTLHNKASLAMPVHIRFRKLFSAGRHARTIPGDTEAPASATHTARKIYAHNQWKVIQPELESVPGESGSFMLPVLSSQCPRTQHIRSVRIRQTRA